MLLFFEDHLATIEDLDAVNACHLASTVDPVSTIGIDPAWHFGDAWKASPEFQEGFAASRALCDEFIGGDYNEVW
jgi:hypothetical protein